MPMEGLKRRLSFRKKKKDKVPECSKPHQWQEDEKKVRDGTCSFQVRYLGCVEVFESRGMQVCEEAVKTLKGQCKGKYQRAILYVTGDALRVVDEISKSMIVDQTIEKVSFCAPDRNHEKGFAYICRDGTTRRWMCHGFLAVKESGERLSHAVGCAFAICLERKQKRDKDSGASNVTVTYSQDRTTFERTGSFRQTTITERITDPQSAIVAVPVPVRNVHNPHAVQRPHASQNLLLRQGSFRGFSKLQEASSPFKRTLSLRLNELPSTLQRQNAVEFSPPKSAGLNNNGIIQEVPSPENEDSISQMCQQLTQGLSAMTTDPFSRAPVQNSHHGVGLVKQQSMPATFHTPQPGVINHPAPPIHETNPWALPPSPAHSLGSSGGASQGATPKTVDPFLGRASPSTNPFLPQQTSSPGSNGVSASALGAGTTTGPHPHLQGHSRSHSVDSSNLPSWQQPQNVRKQTLLEMTHHKSFQINGGDDNSDWASSAIQTSTVTPTNTNINNMAFNQSNNTANTADTFDPFDVAWAARQDKKEAEAAKASNPFATKTFTTYKVEL